MTIVEGFKCFFFLDSPFTKWDNRSLTTSCLLLYHILYYQWLIWLYTFCYYCQPWILFLALTKYKYYLNPLAFSLWCPISVKIYRTYCISFTLQVALAYKFVFLLNKRFKIDQKTCSQVFSFALSWCICYLAKFYFPKHSYDFLLPYYRPFL